MTEEIIKAETESVETGIVCSVNAETQEERLQIFDAVSNATALDDVLGEPLRIRDVIVQKVDYANEVTGEVEKVSRIILIADDGVAYSCTSKGVSLALQNLIGIVGKPTWEPPLPLKAIKKQGNNGYKYTTLITHRD